MTTATNTPAQSPDGIVSAAILSTPFTTGQPRREPETVTAAVSTRPAAQPRSMQPGRTLIGSSPAAEALREAALEAASVNWTLLITGPTGTGKTTVARFIHDNGPRARRPFVEVNCAAIPDTLVESKLFGHTRGAFTGAVGDQPGAFEEADGGTLFFDEIGDLSLEAQAKLLTAIEQKAITRVGSNRPTPVDVRIIAATKHDVADMVSKGTFRDDLYQRISFLEIAAPSLDERRSDIPALAEHLAALCARDLDLPRVELDAAVLDWLAAQPYPGNVRDLHRTVSKLSLKAARSGSARVTREHVQQANSTPAAAPSGQRVIFGANDDIKTASARVELAIIEATLRANGDNMTKTAKRLGLNRGHLPKYIETLKAQLENADGSPRIEVVMC